VKRKTWSWCQRNRYTRGEDLGRKLRPLAALAMVALIGAGCSNDSAENGNTGTASSSGGASSASSSGTASSGANKKLTARQKAVKFADCMRDNGVDEFPDPDASGGLTIDGVANGSSLDTSTPSWKTAIATCKDLQPAGFTGPGRRGAGQQEAALEFAQCMRDNGVKDFPDPANDAPLIDTSRIPSAAGRGARSIPGFQAAVQTCRDVLADALAGE
jgi:hypothetical protein